MEEIQGRRLNFIVKISYTNEYLVDPFFGEGGGEVNFFVGDFS